MPTLDDMFNQLTQANANLQGLRGDIAGLTNVAKDIKAIDGKLLQAAVDINAKLQVLLQDTQQIIAAEKYTNKALFHITQQNDTIICNLEKIARNTCEIWNEAQTQTKLQKSIECHIAELADLAETVHAAAFVDLQRRKQLQTEIERCCPSEQPRAPCEDKPCPALRPIEGPPKESRPPG